MKNLSSGFAAVLLAVVLFSPREAEAGVYRRILNARGSETGTEVANFLGSSNVICYNWPLFDLATERLVGSYFSCFDDINNDPDCNSAASTHINGTVTANLTIDGSSFVHRG